MTMMRPAALTSGLIVACALAASLTGCTGAGEPTPTGTAKSSAVITDAVTCTAFSDVTTIIANADAGLRDGRMAAQEQHGWYELATRVLDRVPTSGDGEVSRAVLALKEVAPVAPEAAMGKTGFGSLEWNKGIQTLSQACTAAGSELFVAMFTGG